MIGCLRPDEYYVITIIGRSDDLDDVDLTGKSHVCEGIRLQKIHPENYEHHAFIIQKVIHFGANGFLICDFQYAVNSNFFSRTHRLTTIHNVSRDRQTTDGCNTVA